MSVINQRSILFNSLGHEFGQDISTGSFQIISYEHKEIHNGSHFNYCDFVLGAAVDSVIEFILQTPDTTSWVHFSFVVNSSAGITVELFEGASGITGGTSISPRNNNRNSTNTADITIIKDPSGITSDGTRAAGYVSGANKSTGFIKRENEHVLKQNETYLTRITSLDNGNDIGWCAEWYEHVDIDV